MPNATSLASNEADSKAEQAADTRNKAKDDAVKAKKASDKAQDDLLAAQKDYEKKYGDLPDIQSCTGSDANTPLCQRLRMSQTVYDDKNKELQNAKINLTTAENNLTEATDAATKAAQNQDPNAPPDRNALLGCAVKTGRVSLALIPYFITYIINFILALIGLICVLFIMIGGYYYVYGGLTDEKEKGKNFIKHALMGMGVALLSWTVVNIIIKAITG